MSQNHPNPVVLITGASSGIGAGMALEYARRGASLALLARRKDRLEQVREECLKLGQDIEVQNLVCDVTDASALKKAVDSAKDKFKRLDVVVANAGYAVRGHFAELAEADYKKQFEVNVFALMNTVHYCLDEILRSKGRIALSGSVSSYISNQGSSAYSMSKYAVRALAESMFKEMKPLGVSVTLLCPGFVESEIRRLDANDTFQENISEPIPGWMVMDTRKAAKQMVRAIEKRKREKIITSHGKIAVFLKRHFPFLVSRYL